MKKAFSIIATVSLISFSLLSSACSSSKKQDEPSMAINTATEPVHPSPAPIAPVDLGASSSGLAL